MSARAAAAPWYCAALRRVAAWLADTAQRLEARATGARGRAPRPTRPVHRCEAAEERLREMRTRYY